MFICGMLSWLATTQIPHVPAADALASTIDPTGANEVGGAGRNLGEVSFPEEDELNFAPEIVNFGWSNPIGHAYIFTGRVIDEYPRGMTITFGGILLGETTTVLDDGSFTFSKVLGPDDVGPVTAQTVDAFGLYSNLAESFVY